MLADTHSFAASGIGGDGGNGGNALAQLLNDNIHNDGSGNITILLEAKGGGAGAAGGSLDHTGALTGTNNGSAGSIGTTEIDINGNTIHGGTGSGTISVTAQFDQANGVLKFNNNDIETGSGTETIKLAITGNPAATLSASGNHFVGNGTSETLDLSGWDRAVDIDLGAGTIKLDAAAGTASGTVSGFANLIGTAHADSFENLSGNISVTGGSAADSFGLASSVLSSTSIPTVTDFHTNNEVINLSALLDAKFGAGSDPSTAGNFVQVKEDASGNSATLSINLSGTPGGTFVAAAHLGGVHAGNVVAAVLDHAHTTGQLTAHA